MRPPAQESPEAAHRSRSIRRARAYWVAGTLLFMALGIGGGLFFRRFNIPQDTPPPTRSDRVISYTVDGVPDPRFDPFAKELLGQVIAEVINLEVQGLVDRAELSAFELEGILCCDEFFPAEPRPSGDTHVTLLRHGTGRTILTTCPEFPEPGGFKFNIEVVELPHIDHMLIIERAGHTVTLMIENGEWTPSTTTAGPNVTSATQGD